MSSNHDSVLRAMTDDGGFRVITARTTETVRHAVRVQRAKGETARHFGELITGAVLYRETMAPNLRVQVILEGSSGKRWQLVADSLPTGGARGLVRLPKDVDEATVREGSVLQMMRTMPRGDVHRGVVEVPDGNISDALMVYMQESEQIVSMISVGCATEGDEVKAAGGYIVQLLPELEESMLAIMTERLKDFRRIEDLFETVAATPAQLLDELLYGMAYTKLDESGIRFECSCSEVRVMTTLGTLPRSDIEELMADGGDIEMTCDYCATMYRVPAEKLRGLLQDS